MSLVDLSPVFITVLYDFYPVLLLLPLCETQPKRLVLFSEAFPVVCQPGALCRSVTGRTVSGDRP